MPTITVDKDRFFRDLGKAFTDKEFDELLFDFGLELDEDTSVTTPEEKPYKLKIEVPANRYDLLCHQGLILALRTYVGSSTPQIFTVSSPPPSEQWTAYVRPATAKIRPYFASAILRGIHFDDNRYKDLIDLQDKLHGNLCRKRQLVSIGTHDLDKMDASKKEVSVEALPPKEIKFAPLNRTEEYTGEQLMTLYESDKHLSKYLHIIRESPVYPIIFDTSRTVLSLPPIINSDHTKITLNTRDVFIDVTALDPTKLDIVINVLVTMFSQYCSKPFTVEPVKIVYEHSLGLSYVSPRLEPLTFTARLSQINSICGLSLTALEACALLNRMGHHATPGRSSTSQPAANASHSVVANAPPEDILSVRVSLMRPDILHECDLVEDVAVAWGFNKIKRSFPATNTVGKPQGINTLGDLVRKECAMAGWLEVLPLTLCSHDENFAFLNRKDDKTKAVVLSNPATFEYQVVRTSLLPGLLKTIRENREHPLPVKIFEVSDVVLKDDKVERKARNVRRLGAVFWGKKAGFEVVHGLLDRVMSMVGVELIAEQGKGKRVDKTKPAYYIRQADDPTFFPGRAAKVFFRPPEPSHPNPSAPSDKTTLDVAPVSGTVSGTAPDIPSAPRTSSSDQSGPLSILTPALLAALPGAGGDLEIGSLGILHPEALSKFELDYPCSVLEVDLEPFL